jgi:hypothetical protein
VGVLEVGRRLDLGQEPLGSDDRRELGLQDLDRDLALMPEIVGQVDRGHASGAELTLDAVPALEGGVQTGDGIGHRYLGRVRIPSPR